MGSIPISFLAFGFITGGTLLGMRLRGVLPERHLISDSKETVRAGMGLVTTITALVLSLLIASAKSSFDVQNIEVNDLSSKVILLDRVLSHYGPEAKGAREELRKSVVRTLERVNSANVADSQPGLAPGGSEELFDMIQALTPTTEAQRSCLSQASGLLIALGQTRWLMYEQRNNSVTLPLLVVLIFWLTALFISFGLFAPRNGTVGVALLVAALSVSCAIFIILELYTPYAGVIRISDTPLRSALTHLGQ